MIRPVGGMTIHKNCRIPFVEYSGNYAPDFRGLRFHSIPVEIKKLTVIPDSYTIYRSILVSPVPG
jgi:hypothetical protein